MAKPWYELIYEQSVEAKCQVDQMLPQIVGKEAVRDGEVSATVAVLWAVWNACFEMGQCKSIANWKSWQIFGLTNGG